MCLYALYFFLYSIHRTACVIGGLLQCSKEGFVYADDGTWVVAPHRELLRSCALLISDATNPCVATAVVPMTDLILPLDPSQRHYGGYVEVMVRKVFCLGVLQQQYYCIAAALLLLLPASTQSMMVLPFQKALVC